jgi:hypothetical protein
MRMAAWGCLGLRARGASGRARGAGGTSNQPERPGHQHTKRRATSAGTPDSNGTAVQKSCMNMSARYASLARQPHNIPEELVVLQRRHQWHRQADHGFAKAAALHRTMLRRRRRDSRRRHGLSAGNPCGRKGNRKRYVEQVVSPTDVGSSRMVPSVGASVHSGSHATSMQRENRHQMSDAPSVRSPGVNYAEGFPGKVNKTR